MSSISREDLTTLRRRNPHLIFIIGHPFSGKSIQIQKVANDFKYSSIDVNKLIDKESKIESDLGYTIKDCLERGDDIQTNTLCSLVVKGIIECGNDSVLIENFPQTLEQALYFEQHILPINLILKFNCNSEICHDRYDLIMKDTNKQSPEDFQRKYDQINNSFKELVDFYSPYGIIREIESIKTPSEVNILVKQNLYPIIYTIIGKRYSGKTTLSKVLNSKMGITLLDFGEFLQEPQISSRINENNYVISQFILRLRKMRDIRVLIENFPQTQEQYSYFINNCKNIEKIYYLNADDSSCLERANKIKEGDCNYTDCSTLQDLLHEFDQKKPFIEFLRKKIKIEEINVNSHEVLTVDRMMKQIQPYCAFVNIDGGDQKIKDEVFGQLKEKYNFIELIINDIVENANKRKIIYPEKKCEELSLDEKIKLIRPLLFKEGCEKIILNTFPLTMEELSAFENNLCKINKYINVSKDLILTSIKDQYSIPVQFYKENKFYVLNPEGLNDYKIKECLDMTRDINIVYGMPLSGKSIITKHLQTKYNYSLLDFKELIEKVKKTKIDPENPDAEPEITFQDLLKGLEDYLLNEPLNSKVIVENFFIPNPPEPYLIDTYEKASEIIKKIGGFRNLYEIDCSEETLLARYKAKENIEEMTEEQKNAFNENCANPKKLLDDIRSLAANIIHVQCDDKEDISKEIFDKKFGRNFVILKHEYDIILEKTLELYSARNRVLYINVPKLIYSHFYENDEWAKKLEGKYGKKIFKVECKDPKNFDEFVYYKYNPINFEKSIVNEVIKKYCNENAKTIENSGNFVILGGYLNYDLLLKPEEPYNLPLLEIRNSMELGDLTCFIQITREDIKEVEDEEAVQLVIEKPKKKKKAEGEEGEEGEEGGEGGEGEEQDNEEEAPPEEENPDAPRFKPEDYKWTSYDGIPRNYVQVLKRLKMFPVKYIEASDNCREELVKCLDNHFDKFYNREGTDYKGIIDIIKLNGEVPQESIEEVNAVSKLIETRREAEGLGPRGKKDKSDGGIAEIL